MKKIFTKFWPIIFIFSLWFIFSSPYFIKGNAPFAASYQLNNFAPWNSYSEFAGPVKNGAMPDVITQIYPWRSLVVQIWKSGQIPLWNPYSFSGTPLLANYQSAVLSPFNILFFILPFVDGWSMLVLLQPLLAGLFTYLFVRSLNKTEVASLFSAVSFMFCGFLTTWMGYATLGYAVLFLPLSLFSIEKYYTSQSNRYLVLFSLTIPLSFFSGHFQISLYFLISLVSYLIYKLIEQRNLKIFIKTILFLSFGILLSMPQLLPSVEFYSQSFRSGLFEKGEVIPFEYISTFFAPDFFGNPVTRNDWFGHYAEWNAYIGLIPLMLSLYLLTAIRKGKAIFFLLLGLISLSLSLDTKIADLFINLKIPVLSTSAMSRIIVVYSFSFAVLSAFGMDQLIEDLQERRFKKIVSILCLFLFIFLFLWIIFPKQFMPFDKGIIARSNLKLPIIIFLSSSLFILFATWKKKLIYIMPVALLIITSFDLLRFSTKWQEFSSKKLVFASVPISNEFVKISGKDRSISNMEAGVGDYYNLLSLEGYDALYVKKYGELIASLSDGVFKESSRSVVYFPRDGKYIQPFVNLLDVKYVIHKISDGRVGWAFPFWENPSQFVKIYSDAQFEIYENKSSFPHAFLAGDYILASNDLQIVKTLVNNKIDLRKTVVLEEDPKISKGTELGSSNILKYSPNEVKIETNTPVGRMLFLSDNFYPGWKATIDGKETKIYRADYTFRAVPVPSGKHIVKFIYEPFSFVFGSGLALAGGIGIAIFTLIPKFLTRKSSSWF